MPSRMRVALAATLAALALAWWVTTASPATATSADATVAVDTTFAPPAFDGDILAVARDLDGTIVVGGTFTSVGGVAAGGIARLLPNGQLDTTFTPGAGFSPTAAGTNVLSIELPGDGTILVGGAFTSYKGTAVGNIARLKANGDLDTSFVTGSGFTATGGGSVNTLLLQDDGKLLVGGAFSQYNGSALGNIARLTSTGSLDSTFATGAGFTMTGAQGNVSSLLVVGSGKVLAGGFFEAYAGQPAVGIARLASDGAFDPTFDAGTGFLSQSAYPSGPLAMGLQPDGKVLAAGAFVTYNGNARGGIVRLNTNGALDTTFAPGTGLLQGAVPGTGAGLDMDDSGRILVGGAFTSYDGTARSGIVRTLSTGAINTTFRPGTGFAAATGTPFVSVVDIALDGSILAAGHFTSFDGTAVQPIVKLAATGVPSAPTNVVATPGTGQATVSFTAPASTDGLTISNYEYSVNGGITWQAFSPAQTTSPVTIPGLQAGSTYYVSLRSVTSQGPGAASAPVQLVMASASPTTTSTPTATATATATATSTHASTSSSALPKTGAEGIGRVLWIAGVFLTAGLVLLLVSRKRTRRAGRHGF